MKADKLLWAVLSNILQKNILYSFSFIENDTFQVEWLAIHYNVQLKKTENRANLQTNAAQQMIYWAAFPIFSSF